MSGNIKCSLQLMYVYPTQCAAFAWHFYYFLSAHRCIANMTWHMALMLYRCPPTFLQSVTFNTSSLFQADIKPNGTDTHQLTKLLDRGIVDCQCALVCVSAPGCTCPCVLQMFIGRCHSYAALPSRDHAEIRPQVLCCVAKPWEDVVGQLHLKR